MRAKVEELLYILLWTCDAVVCPTFRNFTDSFEAWAYRNGFHRQLASLERRLLIESIGGSSRTTRRPERMVRLTQAGKLHALGGRDPEACWSQAWDGRWRLVLYDLPAGQGTLRNQVRNRLRALGFGWLQNSVWVSPRPFEGQPAVLVGGAVDVESLLFLEARTCGGETDLQVVAGAWDFEEINQLYSHYLAVLGRFSKRWSGTEAGARRLRQWLAEERVAWLKAVSADPLLPERLLPPRYLGRKAWRLRLETLRIAGQHMRSFRG
jgi:DNA-binding transcriptional regulator PaaX